MPLTPTSRDKIARKQIREMFIRAAKTADLDLDDFRDALDVVEAFMADDTAATIGLAGAQTLITNLNNRFDATFKANASLPEKYLLLSYWCLEKGGIL